MFIKSALATSLSYPHTGLPGEGGSGGLVVRVITNLMQWLLLLLGAFCIIGFIVAGIVYLTSAGDQNRGEQGKRGMLYAIIGVIVGLSGFVILKAINTWLGGSSSNF